MRLPLLSLLLLLPAPALSQAVSSRPPIIDMHLHAFASDARWTHRVPNPASGQPLQATTEDAHRAASLEVMDRFNIVQAVASGDHDAVQRWREALPGRVIAGYAFSDPAEVDLAFLRREIEAGRVQIVGEAMPQYRGIAPNDSRMEPIYALAEELDVPVAIHVGLGPPGAAYMGSPEYRMSLSNALLLEDVLVRHPKLRLYVMHAGWPMADEMVGLLHAHPQVYVDLGIIDWALPREEFHGYLRRLVEAGFADRVMFGSDQMVWPEAIGMAVEGVESADFLSPEQKRDILYNNARRFLRLEADGGTRP